MNKKVFAAIAAIVTIAAIVVIVSIVVLQSILPSPVVKGKEEESGDTMEVITTLFPLYDFSRQVGRENVEVIYLLPPGVEAHTFEPSPRDMVRINEADVFVYTGGYMEPWAEDILSGTTAKDLVVANTSEGIFLLDEEHREGEEYGHPHNGGQDPHIWVDPVNAKIMVENIVRAFSRADPRNKTVYEKNGSEYKEKLDTLHESIEEVIARCKLRTIVYGGHFIFGYYAKRYGLTYISPFPGFAPDTEPTPAKIGMLIEYVRDNGIKVIYYEELLEPRVAAVIAEETGAQMLLLHGAHNISKDELRAGVTYLQIMEENLEKLKIGLEYE